MPAQHANQSRDPFGRRVRSHAVHIESNGEVRSFHIRPWIATIAAGLVAAVSIGYLGATGYLLFRDDLIGASLARQAKMQTEYEARIASLRTQLDRVTSRQMHDQQIVETKIDRLLEQQQTLDMQQQLIADAATRGRSFGVKPPAPKTVPLPRKRPNLKATVSPTDDANMTTGSVAPPEATSTLAFASAFAPPSAVSDFNTQPLMSKQAFKPILDPLERNLAAIQTEQFDLVGDMLAQVHAKHAKLADTLQGFGVKVPNLEAPEAAMGGPYIPIADPNAFAAYVQLLHDGYKVLAETNAKIHTVPLANPVPGARISSNFGRRLDPFRRQMAMHSGTDFAAMTGTPVRVTGVGKVTFAGRKGGYGLMVEVKHPSGHATRYAHLSRISVKRGQHLDAGHVVGKVGSTGRSTGPHLHYEVRTSKGAVNPSRFMRAGRKLGL
ncbi:MAG: M23 family metallopeptidase [Pseudomonadota bacterium]